MVLLAAVEASSKLEEAIRSLVEHGSQLGFTIIKALIVFLVGRLVINLLNKLVRKILSKRDIDPSVKTFVGSLVNVSLTILLIISVVGALGVQTTSFAALLASAGVAVGMALSGNLSNFAGGIIDTEHAAFFMQCFGGTKLLHSVLRFLFQTMAGCTGRANGGSSTP